MSVRFDNVKKNVAALYIRVSTIDQAREGYSIDGQRDALLAFCKAHGYEVYDIYVDDGYTGANMDRPDLTRLRQDAKNRKFNIVLVWKLSRLSRRVLHQLTLVEELHQHGVTFRSITEPFDTSSPFGRAFMQMLAVFAELERENIRENVLMGIRRRVAEGYVHGRPVAFGYRLKKKGELTIYEPEAKAVRFIFERYLAGDSLTAIARELDTWTTPVPATKHTKPGYDRLSSLLQRVRIIVDNPTYAGYSSLGGKLYPGRHPAIVPPEVWHEVQRLRQTERAVPKRARRSEYPLAGLIKCGECGRSMSGRRDPNRSRMAAERPYYYYYVCVANRSQKLYSDVCHAWGVSAEAAETAVIERLKQLRLDVRAAAEKALEGRKEATGPDPTVALQEELESVRRARKRWMKRFEEGDDDMASVAWARMRELADQEKALIVQIEEAKAESESETGPDLDAVVKTLENIETILENATPSERREIYRTFIKEVRVYVGDPIGKGRTREKHIEIDTYPLGV